MLPRAACGGDGLGSITRAAASGGKRNLLKTRDTDSNASTNYTLDYDKNGNFTDDGKDYKYIYDAWCHLVKVTDQSNVTVAVYTYNGLGMRISEQTPPPDTNDSGSTGFPDAVVDSYDSKFFIANDLQGRRVATFRGTDTYAKETFIWHLPGASGPHWQGGPLLRDRNAALYANPEKWDSEAAGATRGERVYYNTDFRGNVVALVKSDGTLLEQDRYSATGVPFGIPLGDVTADGVVDAKTTGFADYDTITTIAGGAYQVRADLDLDGDVDTADRAIAVGMHGVTLARSILSEPTVASAIATSFTELDPSTQIAWNWSTATRPDLDLELNSEYIGENQPQPPTAPSRPVTTPLIGCPSSLHPNWSDPAIQAILRDVKRYCGDSCMPIIKCTQCKQTANGTTCGLTNCTGVFGRGCPIVTFCLDASGDLICGNGRLEELIKHEFTHVRQCCDQGGPATCNDHICRELEAYRAAGQCPSSPPDACCARACGSAADACGGMSACEARCRQIAAQCGLRGRPPSRE